ncbi:hypothetical protein Tco_1183864 [Tanacetum coccineum]
MDGGFLSPRQVCPGHAGGDLIWKILIGSTYVFGQLRRPDIMFAVSAVFSSRPRITPLTFQFECSKRRSLMQKETVVATSSTEAEYVVVLTVVGATSLWVSFPGLMAGNNGTMALNCPGLRARI